MATLIGIKEHLATLQASILAGKDPVGVVATAFKDINSPGLARPLDLAKATRFVPEADKGAARAALSRQLATDRISAQVKPRSPAGNKTERGKKFQKEAGKGPEKGCTLLSKKNY